ncbi:MAG: hypothetical protein ACE5JF_07970 [Anaerolineales bacterium]
MSIIATERAQLEKRLRLSLVNAFHAEPLLVTEEMLLHGPRRAVAGDEFQAKALALLRAEPTIAEAEFAALRPLGPEVWDEISTLVESHFDSEPAIPDRDLAVYSPSDEIAEEFMEQPSIDQIDEIARLALATGAHEIEALEEVSEEPLPEHESETKKDLALAEALTTAVHEPASRTVGEEAPDVILPPADVEAIEWDLAAAMDPSRLTPLPLVAAALEAVGLDEEKFGFLLRYGAFAPTGRTSEFQITGLGMAEFSNRAAEWFEAMGASKFPVQVIDDGSGNLTVYLLDAMPT